MLLEQEVMRLKIMIGRMTGGNAMFALKKNLIGETRFFHSSKNEEDC